MQVKTTNATVADKLSAQTLFAAMFDLRELFWPKQKKITVLDAFARNGQLTVASYVWRGGVFVDAWELGREHKKELQILGCQKVEIGCSYARVEVALSEGLRYDMIVIDTPQGLHKSADGQVRVEHFSFLPECLPLLGEGGVLVLYVNTDPYDARKEGEHGYDTYAEYDFKKWMTARLAWYGTNKLTIGKALDAYRRHLEGFGYKMTSTMTIPCLSDVPGKDPYAFRLAMRVVKA